MGCQQTTVLNWDVMRQLPIHVDRHRFRTAAPLLWIHDSRMASVFRGDRGGYHGAAVGARWHRFIERVSNIGNRRWDTIDLNRLWEWKSSLVCHQWGWDIFLPPFYDISTYITEILPISDVHYVSNRNTLHQFQLYPPQLAFCSTQMSNSSL